MNKYYDKQHNRLVFCGKKADSSYWDKHWLEMNLELLFPKKNSPFDDVVNISKKYLPPNSLILEGGCGTGVQVHKLKIAGFKVIGVDYAPQIIEKVKLIHPEIDVRIGDVRNLSFENNTFDAYWSFGVIEHFYSGYDEIMSEIYRVLKPNGHLFISFPHLNMLRRLKIGLNFYPLWLENENELAEFYQFALSKKQVITDLKKHGFELLQIQFLSGIKGLKDEIPALNKSLQKIYDSQNVFGRVFSRIISILFNRFSSHSVRLILKKNENVPHNTAKI